MSANRVTDQEVLELVTTDKTDVKAFMAVAHQFVETHLVAEGYDDDLLKMEELLLTCHFIVLDDRQLKKQTIGPATDEYVEPKVGFGLKSTVWGQQAIALDPNGVLEKLDLPKIQAELYAVEPTHEVEE